MIPIQLHPLVVQQKYYFTITVTPDFKPSGSEALGMTYQLQLRGPKGAAYYINCGDGERTDVDWGKYTKTIFAGCPADILAQVPKTWGGTKE